MSKKSTNSNHDGMVEVFCRYITRKGKKIYRKNGGYFHFWVKAR